MRGLTNTDVDRWLANRYLRVHHSHRRALPLLRGARGVCRPGVSLTNERARHAALNKRLNGYMRSTSTATLSSRCS